MAKFYLYERNSDSGETNLRACALDFEALKERVSVFSLTNGYIERYEVLTVKNEEIYFYAEAFVYHGRPSDSQERIRWTIVDAPVDEGLKRG
jgi:hypothetical protein